MDTYKPLVKFLAEYTKKGFSAEEMAMGKRSIIDCTGVIVAGVKVNPLPNLLQLPLKNVGDASILGYGTGFNMQDAALYNGLASHILDLDDISVLMMGHPTVVVLPAVYALGEHLNSSGKEVIGAFLAGVEVACKLGVAYGKEIHARGWHATGVFGSIAAGCACGVLLGFNEQQFRYVIGAAASLACGLRANFGTATKSLHVGIACQNGLLAALLVEKGLTSSANALDGGEGFIQLFTGAPSTEEKTDLLEEALQRSDAICYPGFTLKAYPSCSSNHHAIGALMEILAKHPFGPEDVEKIESYNTINALRELVTPDPKNEMEARFSPGFHFALAVNGIPIIPANFNVETINRPQVQKIIKATELIHYPPFDNQPNMDVGPAWVKVILKDGTTYQEECWYTLGHLKNDFTPQQTWEKFSSCSVPVIGETKAKRFYDALNDLENAASIREVLQLSI